MIFARAHNELLIPKIVSEIAIDLPLDQGRALINFIIELGKRLSRGKWQKKLESATGPDGTTGYIYAPIGTSFQAIVMDIDGQPVLSHVIQRKITHDVLIEPDMTLPAETKDE